MYPYTTGGSQGCCGKRNTKRTQGASPNSCLQGPSLHSRGNLPSSSPGICPPLPIPSPRVLCLWMDQWYQPWWTSPDPASPFSLGTRGQWAVGAGHQRARPHSGGGGNGEAKAKPNAWGWGRRRGTHEMGKGGEGLKRGGLRADFLGRGIETAHCGSRQGKKRGGRPREPLIVQGQSSWRDRMRVWGGRRGNNRHPVCPLGTSRNICLQRAGEVGQAPLALWESPMAQRRVAFSVLPTQSHPEAAQVAGCSAGWLQRQEMAP